MNRIPSLQPVTPGILPILGLALFFGMARAVAASGETGGDSSPPRVPVTREQVERFGIKIAEATVGVVRPTLRVPGEIRLNADRVAHVVPRASGIVRIVSKTHGDPVASGEVLAWVESEELAEAQLDFYAKASEVSCADLEVPRARALYENVAKLVELLKRGEGVGDEDLNKLDALEMGAYRRQLLVAHSNYRRALTVHERERNLRDQGIGSGQEFIAAETQLKEARATFLAALDTASYETRHAYTEAVRERQVAEFNEVAAEKRLRLMGADEEVIAALQALVHQTHGPPLHACEHADTESEDSAAVGATLRGNDRFAWFALRAPFDGTVIAKHITEGAAVDGASASFTIADLSTVWVDLAISQRSIPLVQDAAPVTLHLPGGGSSDALIDRVFPLADVDTRTTLARVVLDNGSGRFRPGTFVEAIVSLTSQQEAIVIPKSSIQLLYDHSCVFVWRDGGFELREVVTGSADGDRVEVIHGLQAGEKVAAVNAFHLKAEYIKSVGGGLGAGHGHPH